MHWVLVHGLLPSAARIIIIVHKLSSEPYLLLSRCYTLFLPSLPVSLPPSLSFPTLSPSSLPSSLPTFRMRFEVFSLIESQLAANKKPDFSAFFPSHFRRDSNALQLFSILISIQHLVLLQVESNFGIRRKD